MAKHRCAILDDYQDAALAFADWSRLGPSVEIVSFREHVDDRSRLAAELAGCDIVVVMRERTAIDADLLARLPALKLLVTTGMVNAAIDMGAARGRDVIVCGTRGISGPPAELAWGMLIALLRNIPAELSNFRAGGERWQLSVGRGLEGKTLGVVGLGRLGTRVAGYGKAFGMDVLGWSRNNSPERCEALGIGHAAGLDDLLRASDVVSLHVALNSGTRGLIGARELGLMRPGAILVNTARGPLVDEAALIETLEAGRLGGAALDVFDREPLPADHPFRRMPNVVATPHIGYVTEETYRVFFADAVESIAAWLQGAPVRVLNGQG